MRDEGAEREVVRRRWRWLGVAVVLPVILISIGIVARWRVGLRKDESKVEIADVSSVRLLGLGSVVGYAAPYETHAWLGIPYAAPPVGALRWRAPTPPEAWADTLDALTAGSPCVQLESRLGGVATEDPDGIAGSEDCLYLNVWAPRMDPDEMAVERARLPVMVWIHGGGNTVGHGGAAMYDGARLAGTQEVVVVSFNYRLGPFGWFSHPALRALAANPEEASGNFGTLDQIRALEWVRSNIREFGGDPDNVTIFGESAGATDVLSLLVSAPAKGLFHRAIAQSGSTRSVSRAAAENALDAPVPGRPHGSAEIVASLLERAGIVPDREAARRYAEDLPEADLADFLRGRSARELIEAFRDPDRPETIAAPMLIRDGSVLPEDDWLDAFRAGRFHPVPVILGSNRDEMKLFLSQDPRFVRRRFRFLYGIRDPRDYARKARIESDRWRDRAVRNPAAAMTASGHADVFAYRFDWDELPRFLGVDFADLLGAAHGFEIPFVFGNFTLGDPILDRILFVDETRETREALSDRMRNYWARFARRGRPGRGGSAELPEWEPWAASDDSKGRSTFLVFDSESDGGIRLVRE